MAARTFRSSAWAQTAPKAPALAPTTATGLFRSGFVATGRETQSSAFFSEPGMDELYSGRCEEDCVRFADCATQGRDRHRGRLDVVLLVVRRHLFHALVEDEIDLRREKLLRRAEELRVVRVPAQAARDRRTPSFPLRLLDEVGVG